MQDRGSEPNFSEPWHMSDAILVVEGERFHVHRSTLSMCSPVFERMFTADFQEKNLTEIQLPDKKASEIEELLLMSYPHSKPVDESNVYFLLSLADEYQMGRLTKRCEEYLLQRRKSKSQSIDFLVIAQKFNLKVLREQCIKIAKDWPLSKLKAHKMYKSVSLENGRELAEKRLEQIENSCQKSLEQFFKTGFLFHAPFIWVERKVDRKETRKLDFDACLEFISLQEANEKNTNEAVRELVKSIYNVALQSD